MIALPHLEQLSPTRLTTDKNVRADLQLTKPFLDSIKKNGVLEPIVAYPDPISDGCYRIHLGHRRAAAAIEGNVARVPVYVISEGDAAQRITEQLAENIHRQDLSPAEVADGYLTLSLFGKSAMTIAKNTSTKLARVGDALKVAKSPGAVKALERYQLTIDDALVFADFEGDADAVELLNERANRDPSRLAHLAQQLRNDRTAATAHQVVIDQIVAAGLTLIDHTPAADDKTIRQLRHLYHDEAMTKHVSVDEARAEASDDMAAFVDTNFTTYGQSDTYEIGYAITNWEAHGWHSYAATGIAPGPLTDVQKEDRRVTRDNNRLWVAATQVRINWVKNFLQRRNLPNAALALAAGYFAGLPSDYGYKVKALAHELLGAQETKEKSEYGLTRQVSALPGLVEVSPGQATHVLLAITVAGIEANLDEKKGWSSPSPNLRAYLRHLAAWGYTLSDLETTVAYTEAAS